MKSNFLEHMWYTFLKFDEKILNFFGASDLTTYSDQWTKGWKTEIKCQTLYVLYIWVRFIKNKVLMCHCPYINFNSSSVTDMSIFREVGQKVIQKILRHNSIPISS